MKLLSALIIFAVTLGLSTQSLAETSHNDAQDNTKREEGAHKDHQGHMRSLYPQPKPDLQNGRVPGRVQIVEPGFMATVSGTTAVLKWNQAEDAANYHVQVATDPNFKWLTVDQHMHSGTSMEVKGLEAGKKYYWRVAASNQEKFANSTKGYFTSSTFVTK